MGFESAVAAGLAEVGVSARLTTEIDGDATMIVASGDGWDRHFGFLTGDERAASGIPTFIRACRKAQERANV